jgi:hypothetical protein
MARPKSVAELEFAELAPDYYAALLALGATDNERMQRLGVTRKAFQAYKQGRAFPRPHRLKMVPELDAAYTKNLDAIVAHVNRKPIAEAA